MAGISLPQTIGSGQKQSSKMHSMRKQASTHNSASKRRSISSGLVTNIKLNQGFKDAISGSQSPHVKIRSSEVNSSRSPSPDAVQSKSLNARRKIIRRVSNKVQANKHVSNNKL